MRIGHIQGHISIKLLGEGVMKFNQTIVQFNSNYVAGTSPELHDNILFWRYRSSSGGIAGIAFVHSFQEMHDFAWVADKL